MRIIDLDSPTLSLITPVTFRPGVRLNYYSATPIDEGDILYSASVDGYGIYRAAGVSCSKQKRSIRIGGTDSRPVLAPYLVRMHLIEVRNEKDRERIHGLMVEAGELPF